MEGLVRKNGGCKKKSLRVGHIAVLPSLPLPALHDTPYRATSHPFHKDEPDVLFDSYTVP